MKAAFIGGSFFLQKSLAAIKSSKKIPSNFCSDNKVEDDLYVVFY